jgi:MFS family permease
MLVFSNFNAVLPILQSEWGLSNTEAGLIFTAYQAGYILAVAILSTLTDWVEPRKIYLAGALWAGLVGLGFAFWASGFLSALCWRALGGIGLAGTYMPGMRLVAERFEAARRGFALGFYIATFALGTSISLLLTTWGTSLWGWRTAFALTALGPLLAFAIATLVLGAGQPTRAAQYERGGFRPVLQNRPALRLILAYGAHTWELMGMRGWIVPFMTTSLTGAGAGLAESTRQAGLASSAVLAIGAISHPVAGLCSDRWGRTGLIRGIMLISGACSLGIGWALSWPFWALVLLGLFYGLMVTAESAILSTAIAETAEPAYLGRTMALQSTVGFTAGALAPAAFGLVLDLATKLGATGEYAWGWAFSLLGVGALAGALAVRSKEPSREASIG